MELRLFYRPTCGFSFKVLNFIEQNNLNVELVNISADDAALEELVRVGGKQQVPCLFIDGKAMYESNDIIDWLRENAN